MIQREREERKVLGEDKREMREDETEGEKRRGGELGVGGDQTRMCETCRRDSQRRKLLLRRAEERKSEISQAF